MGSRTKQLDFLMQHMTVNPLALDRGTPGGDADKAQQKVYLLRKQVDNGTPS